MPHAQLTTLHAVALAIETLAGHADGERLLAGSGIAVADLQRPQQRIGVDQERQVFLNATRQRHDLGLALGRRMHVSGYGLLGYGLLSAATLGQALELALRFPALLGTLSLRLRREGEWVRLEASDYRDSAALEVFNVEFCLASLKLICDDLLGQSLPIEAARFAHAAPAWHDEYARNFPCPLTFAADGNGFAFEARWLEARLPLADPVTHRDILDGCEALNAQFVARPSPVERARQLLAAQCAEVPSLPALAVQLGCSSRTLRRQLQAAGSSYQSLLDELRYAQARRLLDEQRLPIYRIAEVMGYAETASFRHAFQRWSGTSPSRFRQREMSG